MSHSFFLQNKKISNIKGKAIHYTTPHLDFISFLHAITLITNTFNSMIKIKRKFYKTTTMYSSPTFYFGFKQGLGIVVDTDPRGLIKQYRGSMTTRQYIFF